MHHHHTHNKKVLLVSFLVISFFAMIEFVGGILTNSLTLLSDAGHMFSDAISLGVGFIAFKISEKVASESKTFGYRRMEILAALFNGLLLIFISVIIVWEALERFHEPQEVSSIGMLIVAIIGAIVNIAVASILHAADTHENMNMHAIYLHVLGDLLGSIGAVIASLLILLFGWALADPIASVIVSFLILKSGFGVTYDAVHVLMEGKPGHLNLKKIQERLLLIPDVININNLHVWSITSDFPVISCHLVISSNNHDKVLKEALKELHDTFHIEHATIQVESVDANLEQYEHHCYNSYGGGR